MRLTPRQIELIKVAAQRALGVQSRIWLFGSRADDTRLGGDIDLLVETDTELPNRAQAICKIYGAIIIALGERKVDVLVKDARTPDAPIFDLAKRTGVLL